MHHSGKNPQSAGQEISYLVGVERSTAAAGLGGVGRRVEDGKARYVEVGRRHDGALGHAASAGGLRTVCSRPLCPWIITSRVSHVLEPLFWMIRAF